MICDDIHDMEKVTQKYDPRWFFQNGVSYPHLFSQMVVLGIFCWKKNLHMSHLPEMIPQMLDSDVTPKTRKETLQYTHHVSAELMKSVGFLLLFSGYRNEVRCIIAPQKVKFLEKIPRILFRNSEIWEVKNYENLMGSFMWIILKWIFLSSWNWNFYFDPSYLIFLFLVLDLFSKYGFSWSSETPLRTSKKIGFW